MTTVTTSSSAGSATRVEPMPSRTAWVLDQIRRGILSGQFVAGQPMAEVELALLYGISKTPVREALKTLAGQGLVRLGDFKGATVTVVDKAMVKDVFGVRALLEPPAVAATVLSGADISDAEALLRQAASTTSDAERSDLNRGFHRVLYSGCGNELLVDILDGLRQRTALISVTLWQSEPSWDTEAHEHVQLWEAASARDAAEVERLTRAHIEHFAARCAAQFD